ncbi:MAG: hypothetical protein R3C18_00685 [Planctomycetaceae bacterium]
MNEQVSANTPDGSAESASRAAVPNTHPYGVSVLGLILGVVSLGLALIPPIAFGQPLPGLLGDRSDEPNSAPHVNGGGPIKVDISFSFGNAKKEEEEEKVAPVAPKTDLEFTKNPADWLTMAAIVSALIGIVVATVGQIREHRPRVMAGTLTCCVAALTWQYFVMGIVVGVAILVLLLILALLSGAG